MSQGMDYNTGFIFMTYLFRILTLTSEIMGYNFTTTTY